MIPVQPPQQAQPMPPPQGQHKPVTIDAVMELLRDGMTRRFRIDIEVDSTITGDESQERQDRTMFIETTTKFIEAWAPIVAGQPMLTELAGELLLFGTRSFRVGRSLEEVIEETVDKLEMAAAQPKPPPQPSPEDQAKLEITQEKGKAEVSKAQNDTMQAKIKGDTDLQLARDKDAREKEIKILDDEMKRRADERAHELHKLTIQHNREAHAQKLEHGDQQHKQSLAKADHDSGLKAKSAEHDQALKKDSASHDASMKDKAAKSEGKNEASGKLEKLFAEISKSMKAPKKIVRDNKGEIVGIEAGH